MQIEGMSDESSPGLNSQMVVDGNTPNFEDAGAAEFQ